LHKPVENRYTPSNGMLLVNTRQDSH
jgi:hypothetical protein